MWVFSVIFPLNQSIERGKKTIPRIPRLPAENCFSVLQTWWHHWAVGVPKSHLHCIHVGSKQYESLKHGFSLWKSLHPYTDSWFANLLLKSGLCEIWPPNPQTIWKTAFSSLTLENPPFLPTWRLNEEWRLWGSSMKIGWVLLGFCEVPEWWSNSIN